MLGTLQAFSYLPEEGQVVGLLLSFISRSSQSMNRGHEQNLLRSSARSSGPGVGGPKSHPPTHTVCRLAKIGDIIVGVRIERTIVFLGLHWGPPIL